MRDKIVRIRVSDAELSALKSLAAARGLSLSDLLRRAALGIRMPARRFDHADAAILVNKTTVVRAAAFKTGYTSTNIDTNTYLFFNDVIAQPASPAREALAPSPWALPPDHRVQALRGVPSGPEVPLEDRDEPHRVPQGASIRPGEHEDEGQQEGLPSV